MILPAQDVVGTHGKTYRFCGFDEIHGYKSWDILEALQLDPTRADAQMWVTSYASIYHRPGVPLFDLCQQGPADTDLRVFFSWYAADFTTDPDFVNATGARQSEHGLMDGPRLPCPAAGALASPQVPSPTLEPSRPS
jgi:hypothetical protein